MFCRRVVMTDRKGLLGQVRKYRLQAIADLKAKRHSSAAAGSSSTTAQQHSSKQR